MYIGFAHLCGFSERPLFQLYRLIKNITKLIHHSLPKHEIIKDEIQIMTEKKYN